MNFLVLFLVPLVIMRTRHLFVELLAFIVWILCNFVRFYSKSFMKAKTNILDSFSDINFRTPLYFLKWSKSSVSVGQNLRYTNPQTRIYEKNFVICVFVLMYRKFSPILILVFKYSRKSEGVRKFISEKLSYKIVFGKSFFLNFASFQTKQKKDPATGSWI
jgi:hypothetical protein